MIWQLVYNTLVYYVRGIASDLKFSLAYFATRGVTTYQIMPTFWEAVAILELRCKLQVIATVIDEALANRKFYRMHEKMSNSDGSSFVYHAVNLYSAGRYILFFANPPHFMKTRRKSIAHSRMSICLFDESNKMTTKRLAFGIL